METQNEVRLTGTLINSKVETTPNGKQIAKLLIETDPPAWMKAATKEQTEVAVFGRTIAEAQKFRTGQFVSVVGRIRPREYNGKRYNDIIGESFKAAAGAPVNLAEPIDDTEPPF